MGFVLRSGKQGGDDEVPPDLTLRGVQGQGGRAQGSGGGTVERTRGWAGWAAESSREAGLTWWGGKKYRGEKGVQRQ